MRVKFDKYFGQAAHWYTPATWAATHKRRPVIAYA
jgi:hypothetical protein